MPILKLAAGASVAASLPAWLSPPSALEPASVWAGVVAGACVLPPEEPQAARDSVIAAANTSDNAFFMFFPPFFSSFYQNGLSPL
jgi:hypothetical protein